MQKHILSIFLPIVGVFVFILGYLGWFPVYSNFGGNIQQYNDLVSLIDTTNTKEFIYSNKPEFCEDGNCDKGTIDKILSAMDNLKIESIDSREKDTYGIIFYLKKGWWTNNPAIYRYKKDAFVVDDVSSSDTKRTGATIVERYNSSWALLDWR